MNKLVCFFLGLIFSFSLLSGQDINQKVHDLVVSGRFNEATLLAPESHTMNEEGLFYLGMSYHMAGKHKQAVIYFDKCIDLVPTNQEVYYFKGISLNGLERYEEALESFDHLFLIDRGEPDYYASKAWTYQLMNLPDSSIKYYRIATQLPACNPSNWFSLCGLLADSEKFDEARGILRRVPQIYPDKDFPGVARDALYNRMVLEYSMMEEDSATFYGQQLFKLDTTSFETLSRLIQIYHLKGDYVKAGDFRGKIYRLWRADSLIQSEFSGFCIDRFEWKGFFFNVFEFFDEPDKENPVKHVFRLVDETQQLDLRIQTEFNPLMESLGKKYSLGLSLNGEHQTFLNYLFNDNPSYEELKKSVIKVFESSVETPD